MAFVGYARVSTKQQELSHQIELLNGAGCVEIFHGTQSGISDTNQAKLEEMLKYIRKGDTVIVTKLDRLGRSLKSILSTVESIHEKSATLRSLDGGIDTSNDSPFARATIALLGTFAQLERDIIVARTQEGRDRAVAAGKHIGRNKTINDKDRKRIRTMFQHGESKLALAKMFNVSRATIYRILTEGKSK
jgi:DNA invertase Pin-like site-specific DNA recombinase